MSDTHRPRRILLVLVALLPFATCGLTPGLRDLVARVNGLDTRFERFERFVAEAEIPSVLVDDRDVVVGTVLEYNDMALYASINGPYNDSPFALSDSHALATVQLRIPGKAPVIIEANRDALLAPSHGEGQSFHFETPDCTGAPLVNPWQVRRSVFSVVYLAPQNDTLYALSPTAQRRLFHVRSTRVQRGVSGDTQTDCFHLSYQLNASSLEPVAYLGQYTPPFRIVEQRELLGF